MSVTLLIFAAGLCRAIDGDTLRCGRERVRLARIDAPELSEPKGRESADWLKLLIDDRRVTCVISGREKYGRLLGECFAGEGPSLSDQLLERGLAERYRGRR
jgi:endonuclease YncB( thermonuclease family)